MRNNEIKDHYAEKISLVRSGENKVRLIVTGHNIKPVNLKIYDASTNIIFKETINNNQSFSRNYDIKDLKPGKIMFEVSNQDNYLIRSF